jgi:hypothetical protein
MASKSTRRIYLIEFVCCWLGMAIALFLLARLAPGTLRAICGDLAPQLDAACLAATAGMIAGTLVADQLSGPSSRRSRLLILVCALVAMLVGHRPIRPETSFLAPSDATIALTLAMTPSMIAGIVAAILCLLLISPRCDDHERSRREDSRQ